MAQVKKTKIYYTGGKEGSQGKTGSDFNSTITAAFLKASPDLKANFNNAVTAAAAMLNGYEMKERDRKIMMNNFLNDYGIGILNGTITKDNIVNLPITAEKNGLGYYSKLNKEHEQFAHQAAFYGLNPQQAMLDGYIKGNKYSNPSNFYTMSSNSTEDNDIDYAYTDFFDNIDPGALKTNPTKAEVLDFLRNNIKINLQSFLDNYSKDKVYTKKGQYWFDNNKANALAIIRKLDQLGSVTDANVDTFEKNLGLLINDINKYYDPGKSTPISVFEEMKDIYNMNDIIPTNKEKIDNAFRSQREYTKIDQRIPLHLKKYMSANNLLLARDSNGNLALVGLDENGNLARHAVNLLNVALDPTDYLTYGEGFFDYNGNLNYFWPLRDDRGQSIGQDISSFSQPILDYITRTMADLKNQNTWNEYQPYQYFEDTENNKLINLLIHKGLLKLGQYWYNATNMYRNNRPTIIVNPANGMDWANNPILGENAKVYELDNNGNVQEVTGINPNFTARTLNLISSTDNYLIKAALQGTRWNFTLREPDERAITYEQLLDFIAKFLGSKDLESDIKKDKKNLDFYNSIIKDLKNVTAQSNIGNGITTELHLITSDDNGHLIINPLIARTYINLIILKAIYNNWNIFLNDKMNRLSLDNNIKKLYSSVVDIDKNGGVLKALAGYKAYMLERDANENDDSFVTTSDNLALSEGYYSQADKDYKLSEFKFSNMTKAERARLLSLGSDLAALGLSFTGANAASVGASLVSTALNVGADISEGASAGLIIGGLGTGVALSLVGAIPGGATVKILKNVNKLKPLYKRALGTLMASAPTVGIALTDPRVKKTLSKINSDEKFTVEDINTLARLTSILLGTVTGIARGQKHIGKENTLNLLTKGAGRNAKNQLLINAKVEDKVVPIKIDKNVLADKSLITPAANYRDAISLNITKLNPKITKSLADTIAKNLVEGRSWKNKGRLTAKIDDNLIDMPDIDALNKIGKSKNYKYRKQKEYLESNGAKFDLKGNFIGLTDKQLNTLHDMDLFSGVTPVSKKLTNTLLSWYKDISEAPEALRSDNNYTKIEQFNSGNSALNRLFSLGVAQSNVFKQVDATTGVLTLFIPDLNKKLIIKLKGGSINYKYLRQYAN